MANYTCPFKVGDRVVPREPSDTEKEDTVNGPGWNDHMSLMVGTPQTVTSIDEEDDYYLLNIGENPSEQWWEWKDSWLIPMGYSLF